MSRLINRVYGRVFGWFDSKEARLSSRRLPAKFRRWAMLALTDLEDRVVPATFTVFNTANSGAGSLRDAVVQANSTPGADTIVFNSDAKLGTDFSIGQHIIVLDSALSNILAGQHVQILGPGVKNLTITASGTGYHMLTAVAGSTTVDIRNMTITGFSLSTGIGSAIEAQAGVSMLLDTLYVHNNKISAGSGGAIDLRNGNHLLQNLTITNNSTGNPSNGGGGIRLSASVAGSTTIIRNSTISNNTAVYAGGIAFGEHTGNVIIENTTVTNNVSTTLSTAAGAGGGGIGREGGTDPLTVTVKNSIIAGNTAANGKTDWAFNTGYTLNVENSVIGVHHPFEVTITKSTNNKIGDPLTSMDAKLLPLGNYGGPMPTHLPSLTSPAIDLYDPGVADMDQRGRPRPATKADAGAVELQAVEPPNYIVPSLAKVTVDDGATNPYTFSVTFEGVDTSTFDSDDFRITGPNSFETQVTFMGFTGDSTSATANYKFLPPGGTWEASDNGHYSLVIDPNQIKSQGGVAVDAGAIASFQVALPLTFAVLNNNDSGPGSLRQAIIDANANANTPDIIVFDPSYFTSAKTISLFTVLPSISDDVTIIGPGSKLVTLRRDASMSNLMVILPIVNNNARLNVSISGISIIGNSTNAITISNENVTLDGMHISGVSMAGSGGGVNVASGGTLTVLNSTIAGNSVSTSGGAIAALGGAGMTTSVNVHNSIISNNTANVSGGGIGLITTLGKYNLSITNSAVVDNTANSTTITSGGGGLFFTGNAMVDSVIVRNSTFSGNKAISGGGMAFNTLNGAAHIQNSTITNNTSTTTSTTDGAGGGGIAVTGGTPGFFIESTIISGNTASAAISRADLSATASTTLTVNFSAIGNTNGYTISSGANNLSTADAQPTALNFSPLTNINNTKVHALLAGSTALEKGSNPANITPALTLDQTGNPRVQPVGTGTIDIGAHERIAGVPSAKAGTLNSVTANLPGVNNPYIFDITYADDTAIDHLTIDNSNLSIVKVGGGFTTTAMLVNISPAATNAPTLVATYTFTPLGGSWALADNGQYEIRLLAGQVKNTSNIAVPEGSLGKFDVTLPMVYTVINADNSGPGSLREAIGLANSTPFTKGLITFESTFFSTPRTIALTSGEIVVSRDLTIQGPGAALLTITSKSGTRSLNINNPSTIEVTISGLTFSGNSTSDAGSVITSTNEKIILDSVVIAGNSSTSTVGGAVTYTTSGGHLEVLNSALVNNVNTGSGSDGGAIRFASSANTTLILRNSTISGNSTVTIGGGVYMGSTTADTTLIVENSTITNNTAGTGGGIRAGSSTAVATVVSSIISDNKGPAASPDIFGFTVNSRFSAIGSSTGYTAGTSSNDLPIGETLGLLPLADNGGSTFTHAFGAASPLNNAGLNSSGLLFDQRGAGFKREEPTGKPDIGAYEREPGAPGALGGPFVTIDILNRASQDPYFFAVKYVGDVDVNVATLGNDDIRVTNPNGFDVLATFVSADPNNNAQSIDAIYKITAPAAGGWQAADNGLYTITVEVGKVALINGITVPATTVGTFEVAIGNTFTVLNDNNSGAGSLRAAIEEANKTTVVDLIQFDPAFYSTPQQITFTSQISITESLIIDGPGAKYVTLTTPTSRTFDIINPGTIEVTLRGMTISGNTVAATGSAMQISNEKVILDGMVIANNTSTSGGGAITAQTSGGYLEVLNSAIINNRSTGSGGGIRIVSSATFGNTFIMRNSTVSGNTTNISGGGIYFYSSGIATSVTVSNSTITDNTSSGGRGIHGSNSITSIATIESTIVTGPEGSGISSVISGFTVHSSFSAIGSSAGHTVGSSVNNLPYGAEIGLLPLADNGGGTFTHAFGADSPLKDAGSNPTSLPFDQRGLGFDRKHGAKVDIGAFERLEVAPTVSGGPYITVTNAKATILDPYYFVVKYIGDAKINTGTIDNSDIRITGPNGFNMLATLDLITPSNNQIVVEALYKFSAPGGSWDAIDNGLYTISMEPNQVFDIDGKAVSAGAIGTFGVVFPGKFAVLNDNDTGFGSLREALTLANLDPDFNEIVFDQTFFSTAKTITLTSGELPVLESAKITGPGVGLMTITNASGRAFHVSNAMDQIEVQISGMTISGNSAAVAGSAIQINDEIVTLDSMVIANNTTSAGGGAIAASIGGSSLTVLNSAIVNNKSTGFGGGFHISSATFGNNFVLRNSTVSGNSASGKGGGMFFANSGTSTFVTIENSTITNNTASVGGGGISSTSTMSTSTSPASVTSSLISGNIGPIESQDILGFKVSSFASAIGNASGFVSTSSKLDLPVGADLMLLPLADNGGNTFTHSFAPGSPLRHAGVNLKALPFDQRGPVFSRELPSGLPDIGAFELDLDIPYALIDTPLANVFNDQQSVNNPYTFTVKYVDAAAMNRASIGNAPADDIEVVRIGGGFNVIATFVSADSAVDVPVIKATYKFSPPGGTWSGFDNGTFEIRTLENGVKNSSGVSVPVVPLGSFIVDIPPPSAKAKAGHVFEDNAVTNPYRFTVAFTDTAALNMSSIINNNNAVRVSGPNGFDELAQYVSIDVASDGTPRTATYQITPPVNSAAGWDKSDNGVYTILMEPNQVFNLPDGVSIPPSVIGSFNVSIGGILTVTITGNSGAGSLRDAIAQANANPLMNMIVFDPTVFNTPQVIFLQSGELSISEPLYIVGPGANMLTINGLKGGRIFNTSAAATGAEILIKDLTITGGSATSGGGILISDEAVTLDRVSVINNVATDGAGIDVALGAASLTIRYSTIGSNSASSSGGGIRVTPTGASAKLLVENSTFTNNTVTAGNSGGAIRYIGNPGFDGFIVRNSTFFGNTSGFNGGAIGFSNLGIGAVALIENSTIVGNTANSTGKGGGIGANTTATAGSIQLINTIVSNNILGGTSNNSSDIYVPSAGIALNVNNSAIGENFGFSISSGSGNIFGQDLKLAPLADNGGPTLTLIPAFDSPVVNAGTLISTLLFDQRGAPFVRQFGSAVDIGAVELQSIAAVNVTGFTVNNGAAQRSRLTTITVTFSGPVSPANFIAPGDIVLTRTAATAAGTVGTIVQTGAEGAIGLINLSQPGPINQLVLTFSNANAANETAGVEYGSLADGRWQLAIPSAGFISALNDPSLRRLFGDFEAGPPPLSNGTVDSSNFGSFGAAFGTSPGVGISPFDFDNNGTIDSTDFAAFGARFGISI